MHDPHQPLIASAVSESTSSDRLAEALAGLPTVSPAILAANGFLQRLQLEIAELSSRQTKLRLFITTNETFDQLTAESRDLLRQQADLQVQLLEVLRRRYRLACSSLGVEELAG